MIQNESQCQYWPALLAKAIIVGGFKPPGPKATQVTWTPNTKTFIKTIYIVIFSYIRRQI